MFDDKAYMSCCMYIVISYHWPCKFSTFIRYNISINLVWLQTGLQSVYELLQKTREWLHPSFLVWRHSLNTDGTIKLSQNINLRAFNFFKAIPAPYLVNSLQKNQAKYSDQNE